MSTTSERFASMTQRLMANYAECEITQTDEVLTIQRSIGTLEVRGLHLSMFLFGQLVHETEFTDEDALYQGIEVELLVLQEEEDECNLIRQTALQNAAKRCRWALYAGGAAFLLLLLGYHSFALSWLFLLLALLMPIVSVGTMGWVRLRSFRRDWVCPHCGCQLPLETGKWNPELEPHSKCPRCGKDLLDPALVEQLKQEVLSEQEEEMEEEEHLPVSAEQPKPGGAKACTVWGILLLVFVLVFGALLLTEIEKTPLAITVVNATTCLFTAAAGVALLRCKPAERERVGRPKIVVREQRWLPVVGSILAILGLALLFASFALSSAPPAPLGEVALPSVLGLFFVGLSVWMLLARKNRTLRIYDSYLEYTTSFGRTRDIPLSQIVSVRVTANRSMQFRDSDGKKRCSIETNMAGADQVIDWMEEQNLSIDFTQNMEQQVEEFAEETMLVSWREEDRTPMHDHLKGIRRGLVPVLLLFAAGCLIPLSLYLFTDLKMTHAIYLTAVSTLPLVLYCIVFAPVLLVGERPAQATKEWNSMHVRFPITLVLILGLLISAQVYYFWESRMLSVVDFGRFFLLDLVVTMTLILLFWTRTPKRLRKGDFGAMILSLIMLGFVMTYGGSLAISGPAEHYPAEVVERQEPASEEDEEEAWKLTVRLDDGKTAVLNVSQRLYQLEEAGADLVVCQKKNPLGIRVVRLHLSEGTDFAALLEAAGAAS